MAVDGGIVQRRIVITPGGVHVRTVIDEQLGDLSEPMVASLMQRAPPAALMNGSVQLVGCGRSDGDRMLPDAERERECVCVQPGARCWGMRIPTHPA